MATNIALTAAKLRYYKSGLGEMKELVATRAEYASRIAAIDARMAAVKVEVEAEITSLGVDVANSLVSINEEAKVLVVEPKAGG